MKYDSQIQALKPLVEKAESVLIALANEPNIDELASALSLFLSTEEAGKSVAIVTEGIIRVGHTSLFGVNHIQNNIPQALNGNLTIVLGGVVDTDQQKPLTLQELKWHPEGNDLHLVFQPISGKRFEPTHITPTYEGGHFDLIFVVGAPKLESLGTVYSVNNEVFSNSNSQVVNIDNKAGNTNFGSINVVDGQAASVSEIIGNVLPQLGLPYMDDIATNILTGIYEATLNLQAENTTAETFMAIAEAVRAGGKKPMAITVEAQATQAPQPVISNLPEEPSAQSMTFMNETEPQSEPQASVAQPEEAVSTETASEAVESLPIQPASPNASFADSSRRASQGGSEPAQSVAQPEQPVAEATQQKPDDQQSSPEEVPQGEEVITPGSDWLTPKIYRGGGVG